MTGVELSPLWIFLSEVIVDYTNAADNDNGQFQEGNANIGLKGTVVDAAWLNAVQTEICSNIIAEAIPLNKSDNGQLKRSVDRHLKEKLSRYYIKHTLSGVVTDDHSLSFAITDVQLNSFVDVDVFVTVSGGGISNAILQVRVGFDYDNSNSFYIPVTESETKKENHRLVLKRVAGSGNLTLSCLTAGGASLSVSADFGGYIDNSTHYT